jgi:hypothetical protein
MARRITFNELRRIKDKMPQGGVAKIAEQIGVSTETVCNYFGGYNYKLGQCCGVHIEKGPQGGIVMLSDTTILDLALAMIEEQRT